MTTKYVLRNLPGVAVVEARLQRIAAHPNPAWAPEAEGLEDALNQLSLRLFGVGYGGGIEIEDYIDDPARFMRDTGWDVFDEGGKPLALYRHLHAVIAFVADGRFGRLPDAEPSDAEVQSRSEEWGKGLEAAVDAFRRKDRRKDAE